MNSKVSVTREGEFPLHPSNVNSGEVESGAEGVTMGLGMR